MSPVSTYIDARLRKDDSSPQTTAAADSDIGDDDDDIFALLPPEPVAAPSPASDDSSRRPAGMADPSRLSIDGGNRLCWDGKPVEVRRRVVMTRAQIAGVSIVAAVVVIGALLQGAIAARDWACRFGWSADTCTTPAPPMPRANIPT
jgi:hypothetical protein